jgi:hypothetical protein
VKFYKQVVSQGDAVTFVREPSNPYDSNAIKISLGEHGTQIGNVPRTTAAFLAPLIDHSHIVLKDGKITQLEQAGNAKMKKIWISISVCQNKGNQLAALDSKMADLHRALQVQRPPQIPGPLLQVNCVSEAHPKHQQQARVQQQQASFRDMHYIAPPTEKPQSDQEQHHFAA